MLEHPICPRCGQPIIVTEIQDYAPMISRPVEQEIVCPQCDGFIATLTSYRRVFTYKAPMGDYAEDLQAEAIENPTD
jgi:predicted amidophosphoribosyltransferase